MGLIEKSPRPAPKIIQDVYDADDAKEQARIRQEEENKTLREQGIQIHDRIESLMLAYIPDPDKIKVPAREKPNLERLGKLLLSSRIDDEVHRKMRLSRTEREEEDYQYKVGFPIQTEKGTLKVRLMSKFFPKGETGHSYRIDIPILSHTIEVCRSDYNDSNFRVSLLSREDQFRPNDPGRMGSPGRKFPKYHNYISLEGSSQIIELLDFIETGIADKSLKPKNLTPRKVLVDEAMNRRPWPKEQLSGAKPFVRRVSRRSPLSSRGR